MSVPDFGRRITVTGLTDEIRKSILKWIRERSELPWSLIENHIVYDSTTDATPQQTSYALNILIKQLETYKCSCDNCDELRDYWWKSV